MAMPMIRVRSVTQRFGGFTAVDDLSLDIGNGEFFALLGASGSGKTTLLRLIGGFDLPTRGRIEIDGEDVTDLRPYQRPTNTVFQSYALFPHLTLAENVGYGLINQRLTGTEIATRVNEALERVRLPDLGRRYPHQVSGGQRQRIALARALICRPKVLLLDEPLGALDKRLREEMHVELREIQRQAGITFVLVTHDQEEAMSLADRIAIMSRGRILQVDTPFGIYERPRSEEVARFISSVNVLEGTCLEHDGSRAVLDLGTFRTEARCDGIGLRVGERAKIAIRPEKIRISAGPRGDMSSLPGTVRDVVYIGDRSLALIDVAGLSQPVVVTIPNTDQTPFGQNSRGGTVTISWPSGAAAVLAE